MSALGQKQTFEGVRAMSALPPKADIGTRSRDVRFVPKADIKSIFGGIRAGPFFASKEARTWSASKQRAVDGHR
jgi:hypothetical protein